MSEITSAPCDFLDWDSKFFGFRIGRVRGNTLTESLMEQAEAWSSHSAIRCLYFLARADDALASQLAQAHGFQLVDVRVTFERRITETPVPVADFIRPARSDDMPVLEFMARTGFAETRFFYDTGFPRSRWKSSMRSGSSVISMKKIPSCWWGLLKMTGTSATFPAA